MSGSITILIVEDEPLIRHALEDALVDGGYDVRLAGSGEEAVASLDDFGSTLCALITDIDLAPRKLTGWDVARHAREIAPQLPVVYITGRNSDDWASKGVPKSILINKPFAPAQVLTAVSQLLNEQSL